MPSDYSEPAFPGENEHGQRHSGVSARDYFAIHVAVDRQDIESLAREIADDRPDRGVAVPGDRIKAEAVLRYAKADALLKERER